MLERMRVLDLSQQLPGPYATQLLAALGATVVKVEPPSGDPARTLDPAMFDRVNAGKESLILDLKNPADQTALHERLRSCDVFVEGFRPGVTKRLGCDWTIASSVNPRLVYCSISGFGQKGPLAGQTSHDLTLQALAGAIAEDQDTDRVGVPWVDLATATTAALAIVAAWHGAQQDGTGTYLDMAMLDAARAWAAVKPGAVANREPTYGTFKTRDGASVTVAILEDDMWQRLCQALGWRDWGTAPDLHAYPDRQRHADQIRKHLTHTLGNLNLLRILDLATDFDLPITATRADQDAQHQLATRGSKAAPDWQRCVPLPADLMRDLGHAPTIGARRSPPPAS